ncbi:UDP-N-acetylenolpyruvoylglucosamine reductase [hydrothermal vent metagenome]|uniref:UDP-N-acetylmuramate dehydrogenase n=1 Tax=hydrothermal vent metagenome TaxID=652676 RepID=A0A3B0RR57_9ZZZZ
MTILSDISLKPYNTFGIDVIAKHFVSVQSVEELKSVLELKAYSEKLILGGGSNMLLTKDVNALVIHLDIKGIEIISRTTSQVKVKANAGENWHNFVLWCLQHDFGGIENLSLIPGNVGTAPLQNIGAYGVELKDVFESCEALHIESQNIKTFTKSDCHFGYRNSIFKQELKGKYIILNVTLALSITNHVLKTDYGAITSELNRLNIQNPSIQDVSTAVINIRKSKLPNPKDIGNSGSFFKNPIVSKTQFKELKVNFPEMPSYIISDTEVKIPAGWLIEQSGFKGKQFGNYGVHKNQALVLVNYGGAKGEDIFKLSKLIQSTIKRLFNITLEAEVNII